MTGIVRRRDRARRDLIDIYRYLAREAGTRTASRFLAQAEATFNGLAGMPDIGTRYEAENPAFAEIRFFPIRRFKKYLVFYLPTARGIDVVRVLHDAGHSRHLGRRIRRRAGGIVTILSRFPEDNRNQTVLPFQPLSVWLTRRKSVLPKEGLEPSPP